MKSVIIRASDYLYSIEGYPNHLYWTGRADNLIQMLFVIQFPYTIAFSFSEVGALINVEKKRLTRASIQLEKEVGIREVFSMGGDKRLAEWLISLDFRESVIRVRKFYLDAYHIGIADFARSFEKILRKPSSYSEDELRIADREKSRWSREGVFELWLNKRTNLWINSTGQIESS